MNRLFVKGTVPSQGTYLYLKHVREHRLICLFSQLTRLETRPLPVETKDVLQRILSVGEALQASGLHPQHPPRLYATLLRRLVESRARELQQQHQQKTQVVNTVNANGNGNVGQQTTTNAPAQSYPKPAWMPQDFSQSNMTLAPEVDLSVPSRQQSPGYNRIP